MKSQIGAATSSTNPSSDSTRSRSVWGCEEILASIASHPAVEVAAADLHVEQEELRFLQMLRDRLGLDTLTVAAIERGARARYRSM